MNSRPSKEIRMTITDLPEGKNDHRQNEADATKSLGFIITSRPYIWDGRRVERPSKQHSSGMVRNHRLGGHAVWHGEGPARRRPEQKKLE